MLIFFTKAIIFNLILNFLIFYTIMCNNQIIFKSKWLYLEKFNVNIFDFLKIEDLI